MHACPDQKGRAKHQSDENTHPVPAIAMPEYTSKRAGDTGTKIVAKQVERRGLPLGAARAWANPAAGNGVCSKKPAEKSNIPANISHKEENSVISRPSSITPVEASMTGPRP